MITPHTNKLINEKSPYLLQHANNPVNWFPWTDEAFELAKEKNLPIFLSIGYATCHWCHVMEKESFEDAEVAFLMNKSFINIKVDREERPDIDAVYMKVCQMINGNGGWPLTIIMYPDKGPFFAGTYFPKLSVPGRIGMIDLINKVNELWNNKSDDLKQSANYITNLLKRNDFQTSNNMLDQSIFENAYNELSGIFDESNGGFGNSPKFPVPHNLTFLLKLFARTGNPNALRMAEKTLVEMRKGGIWDHIGFGFHRYSTDSKWLLPHFEKMLYDQSQLMNSYRFAFNVTGKNEYLDVAKEIAEYILRDMTSPEGAFYSAEDADSEGIEGKFYLWEKQEIDHLLPNNSENFNQFFNIHLSGNFVDETGTKEGNHNILHQKMSMIGFAEKYGINYTEFKDYINSSIITLFESREQRIHPLKDDKILTDWNGLAISAFATLYSPTRNENYLNAAINSAEFILNSMIGSDGNLYHRYRDGERAIKGMLDDYSFLIHGLISLYKVSFDPRYLLKAIELQSQQDEYFWDKDNGGYFLSSSIGEVIISRQKDLYDGAIPSGNSISLGNLLYFSRVSDNPVFKNKFTSMIQAFGTKIKQAPSYYTSFLGNMLDIFYTGREIIIYRDDSDDYIRILKSINKSGDNDIVILLDKSNKATLSLIFPYMGNYEMIAGKTTVYICKNHACERPETDIDKIIDMIENR